MNKKSATESQMPIRLMATGNWQPDANSIFEVFRQFRVIRKQANGSQMQIRIYLRIGNWQLAGRWFFDFRGFKTILGSQEIGKWKPDANLHIHVNWQLPTGSQMPIRFQRISDNLG